MVKCEGSLQKSKQKNTSNMMMMMSEELKTR